MSADRLPPVPATDHPPATSRPTAADGPLHDLRVIDLATVVAGPGCARYLADFGADVIKVERPGGGDTTRAMGWTDPRDDVSFWWKLAGRNKRTITLDLKGRIASTHSLIASQEKQKLQAEASVRECEDGLKTKKYVSCEGVRAIPKGIQESIEKSKKNLREAETAQKRLCF